MAAPQSYKNHTRFDPGYHFLLVPLLLFNLIAAIIWTVHHRAQHAYVGFWMITVAFALLLMAGLLRMYAAKNQDRIIRLEERLRLAALLPPAEAGLAHKLTTRQLIALRFASDVELPTLARRCSTENLSAKQIKESIQTWRPDYDRI